MTKFRGLLFAATLSMLAEFLMGFLDSIIAGNILGEKALSAINVLQTPMSAVSFFAWLIGTGTAICFSVAVGRFDKRRASETFSQGVFSAAGIGLVLLAFMAFGREAFFDALGPDAEVRSLASSFWTWYAPCAFLEPVTILLNAACYADGDGKLCVISYVAEFSVKLVSSVLLTFAMGIGGCGLGTTLGDVVLLGMLLLHFRNKANTLSLVRHFSFADLWDICRNSFGDASTRLCWAGLFFFINKYVIDHYGSGMLPVAGVVVALISVTEAFNGISNAAQPLVGVYMGERNNKGVRTVMDAAVKFSVVGGLALSAVLLAAPVLVLKLLGIDDPELVAAGKAAVRIVSLGYVFWSLVTLFNSYYVFIGRVALSCTLTILANFVAPWLLILALGGFGVCGTWWALALAPVAAVAGIGVYVVLRDGVAKFPLMLDRSRDAKTHIFDLKVDSDSACAVSERVSDAIAANGISYGIAARAALIVEEVLMAVKDRNGARAVLAEVSLDMNDGVSLVIRDDGEIFDITDADAKVSSLRTYLVASIMENQKLRGNLTTTGYNRNVFRFT
ncbi:MAG: hypothetical protein MJ138_06655 [Kiritimatiellae bacterium]|nr:hypothetical protein [Kiritimatiellia bacterium]